MAVSRVHRQAIRVLCGADSLAALEAMAVKRLKTTAWLLTGGDAINANNGPAGYLHILMG